MRLGGPVEPTASPEEWVGRLHAAGYSAAFAPVNPEASDSVVRAFRNAAKEADVVIAEVGAWSNPLASDRGERDRAIRLCTESLELAEKLGARCCVNVAGSVGAFWCGAHLDNTSEETFTRLVETIQRIVDSVQPKETFYTLETSPWNFPHDLDSYQRLLDSIDRTQVAVHFDPVNLINSPSRYFGNAEMIQEFLRAFGTNVKSCHAKDIQLDDDVYTVRFSECRPGEGAIAYGVLIEELESIDPNMPLMLEHLADSDAYRRAADHIRLLYGDALAARSRS